MAGQESRVYIIDSGLTEDHPEFRTNSLNIRWLWAGPFSDYGQRNDADEDEHGTAVSAPHILEVPYSRFEILTMTQMASAALGERDGVAKNAGLTVVRSDKFGKTPQGESRSNLAPETWIDALAQSHDDILNKKLNGRAVISMSVGFNPSRNNDYEQALEATYTYLLNSIMHDLDCPVLAAAGQPAFPNPEVDTVPAILAGSTAPDLIVVSGCNDNGEFDDSTRDAPYVKILAPADQVEVADVDGHDYRKIDGTSPGTLYLMS